MKPSWVIRKLKNRQHKDDFVAIKRTQFVAGRKLASSYLGPYEIITIKRCDRYVEGPNLTETSCDNMKLWKLVNENNELLLSGSDEEYQEGRM